MVDDESPPRIAGTRKVTRLNQRSWRRRVAEDAVTTTTKDPVRIAERVHCHITSIYITMPASSAPDSR